jgi:hypothetical protein
LNILQRDILATSSIYGGLCDFRLWLAVALLTVAASAAGTADANQEAVRDQTQEATAQEAVQGAAGRETGPGSAGQEAAEGVEAGQESPATSLEVPVAPEPKLGDIADGSRADHVHVLDLRDQTGSLIRADDPIALPFSPRQTCQECHDYETISGGWHFNAVDPDVGPGRRGEPWVLFDPVSATQVPLSHRDWQGVAHPEELGLSPFLFTERFGRHLPGGGVSEADADEPLDIYLRWMVSGRAEVNCLGCHDRESGHDQAEYDRQMRQQNYRWAAAATSAFTTVTGSAKAMPDNYDIYAGGAPDLADAIPPTVEYDSGRFNRQGKVLFDVPRRAPEERCYFCHSSVTIEEADGADAARAQRWEADLDVHMVAGLTCVDCHRNGLDHLITRGYEWEAADRDDSTVAAYSCAGCHIRDQESQVPGNGGMGAPYPAHRGLPVVHFEKLACTACHSGPWPTDSVQRVKLSRTHALGTHGVRKGDDVAPYVLSPVFARDEDGKIAPHRMIWPAYWGFMRGDAIEAAPAEDVRASALAAVLAEEPEGGPNVERLRAGSWPLFSEAQMVRILGDLAGLFPESGEPVYVGGGKVFSLDGAGGTSLLAEENHPAAQPYSWAFAHDVRPAEQSLGIRGCDDCHALGAPFSFATVTAPVPFDFAEGATISMTSLQDMNAVYPRVFAFTFLFRPLVKYTIIICSIIMLLVVLLYALKGLEVLLIAWSGGDS